MIYLDNHATTMIDERVSAAMESCNSGDAFANPSSTHSAGIRAKRALESARTLIAEGTPGNRRRVSFTSGATESNALALLGRAPKGKRKGVVVTALEHPSVMECARELERRGCPLTVVQPTPAGLIEPDRVLAALNENTALLAIMLVNNEVGTLQPVEEIAKRTRKLFPKCHIHVDAVQGVGLADLTVLSEASSLSISGHKIHGPKGTGALIFSEGWAPRPLWFGGGQEAGIRSGTQNVAGAVGLAKAFEIAMKGWRARARRMALLRDELIRRATERIEGAFLVGHHEHRSPANAMIAVEGLTSAALVGALDERGVIASTGAACHSGDPRLSEVLESMKHDPGAGTVRFGLSRDTTAAEIEEAAAALESSVKALKRGKQ